MNYKTKIQLNDSTYEVEQVINDSDINTETDKAYITNVILKESTSISDRMSLGGIAANSVYFDLHNPITGILDGVKINLFAQPEDAIEEDETIEFTDEEINELLDSYNDEYQEPVDEEAENDFVSSIDINPDIDNDSPIIDEIFTPLEGEDIEEEPVEEEVYSEENENTRENLVITYDDDPEAIVEDELDETGIVEDDTEPLGVEGWTSLGVFFISQITEKENNTYKIEAQDGFTLLNDDFETDGLTDYINSKTLTFGLVVEEFQAQLEALGIILEDLPSDVYDDLPITLSNEFTLREMAGYLAGFLGCYATFDRFGHLKFRNYAVNAETIENEDGTTSIVNENIPYKDLINTGVQTQTGTFMQIDRIDVDTDLSVSENILTINSTGSTDIMSADGVTIKYENPFMTQEILNTVVAPQYMNLEYMPGTVECLWTPNIETGDILDVYYNETDTMKMLVTNMTVTFGTRTECKIYSLGNTQTALLSKITSPTKRLVKRVYEDITGKLNDAIKDVTDKITGNQGGYVVMNDTNEDGNIDEILIMNDLDKEKATQVWRWNKEGLGFAPSYAGPYATAITNDGHIVGNMIDVIDTSADGSTDPYVYLGSNTSNFGLRLTNREIQFIQKTSSKVLARLTSNALILEDIENDNYIQFGGYAFYPTENGHMTFTKK